MRTYELTEQQIKFINTLVSNGDNQCSVLDAINFAIESWYLGLPTAEEDPVYDEFREHFLTKVIGYKSERSQSLYGTQFRYGTALTEKIGEFYNQFVDDKYKVIKAFTYGFLDGYHEHKDTAKFGEGELCDCDYGFDDYQMDMCDLIFDSISEAFDCENIWDWQSPLTEKSKQRKSKSKKITK
jgi:hypothetical protein